MCHLPLPWELWYTLGQFLTDNELCAMRRTCTLFRELYKGERFSPTTFKVINTTTAGIVQSLLDGSHVRKTLRTVTFMLAGTPRMQPGELLRIVKVLNQQQHI